MREEITEPFSDSLNPSESENKLVESESISSEEATATSMTDKNSGVSINFGKLPLAASWEEKIREGVFALSSIAINVFASYSMSDPGKTLETRLLTAGLILLPGSKGIC